MKSAMRFDATHVVEVPLDAEKVAKRRIHFLLGPQALAMSQNNLLTLLANAYLQGVVDGAHVQSNRGKTE